jgi:acyl-CoA thioesterase FadM
LRTDEFDTCLDDANLVGNIYFARYFTWQSRACDQFLYAVAPTMVTGAGEVQEFLPLGSRMDFLRDAFPFDRIRLEMRVRGMTESAATLEFVFFRVLSDGSAEKLSVGEEDVAWVRRAANGSPVPAPFPDPVRHALDGEADRAPASRRNATIDSPRPSQAGRTTM